jgi:hypothetical protein
MPMTEAEWLACMNPDHMRELVMGIGRPEYRKFRLLACAYARRIWEILDATCREGIEKAEEFADGGIRAEKLAATLIRLKEDTEKLRNVDDEAQWRYFIVCTAMNPISSSDPQPGYPDNRVAETDWQAWDMARMNDWNVAAELAREVKPKNGYRNDSLCRSEAAS